MFILNFIPSWFFPALAILAIIIFLLTKFIKLPQMQLINYTSIVVFALSLFMCGANWNNDYWLAKVREVETKLAQSEAESAKENTKIVEKVVTRREIVRLQGNEIVKYVDREKVVIDENCKLPELVVDLHNKAIK